MGTVWALARPADIGKNASHHEEIAKTFPG
jgi:hypothetical protein